MINLDHNKPILIISLLVHMTLLGHALKQTYSLPYIPIS